MLSKLRLVWMAIVDLILLNVALLMAFMIRFDWKLPAEVLHAYRSLILLASIGRLGIFYFFGLYRWSFRYASLSEAIRIFQSVSTGTLFLISYSFFMHYSYIGRSVLLIDLLLCLFLIAAFRFVFRLHIKIQWKKPVVISIPVLIVGAGDAGAMVARELVNEKSKRYMPLGFVDDDPMKKRVHIHGLQVLGNFKEISRIVRENKVEEIIIALPNPSGKEIRDLISSCRDGGSVVKFKIIPDLQNLLSGKVELKKFRDVKPEDLLGRQEVPIDTTEVKSFLEDKVVLITGAAGSIGSELARQAAQFHPSLLLLWDHNENEMFFLQLELKKKYPRLQFFSIIGDIREIGLLKYIFSTYRPHVVFHAAAHKHVPLMEENPAAAVRNNIIATRNLVYASEHYKVERFVLISTDKAVNPTSVMGVTKRITEMLLQAKAQTSRTKFMAVRFGNVIGSNGSVVQVFKKQIEEGRSLTVTHPDIRRYFMMVNEAVQLVLQAGGIGKGGEIFILDMGEQIKIVDLAVNLIALSGLELDKDISIEYTGLRPGEKLYEEVLHDMEHDQATHHNKIFIAQPEPYNLNQLKKDIEELKNLSDRMDEAGILRKMKEMVPSYRPTLLEANTKWSVAT